MNLGVLETVWLQSLAAVLVVWVIGEALGLSSRALAAALVVAILTDSPAAVFGVVAIMFLVKGLLFLKSLT